MDEARKLLDSLMGSHRNVDRKEAKAKKGNNFKEDNICKFYLIGFCPQHEDLFHSTKRDIGRCCKVHSEAMKSEFEEHPDKEKFLGEYERQLKNYLEELARGADERVARERRNIQAANQQIEEAGPNETAKAEIQKLNDQAAALVLEAETFAEDGKFNESKVKLELADGIKKRAADWEEKARAARSEDFCEICGSRTESGDPAKAKFRHEDGKIHAGFVKIREWLAEIRKRVREREERGETDDAARRGGGRDPDRDRRRSRSGGRGGDRDRDRDRRGRDRDRGTRADEQDRSAAAELPKDEDGAEGEGERPRDREDRARRGRDSYERGERDRSRDRRRDYDGYDRSSRDHYERGYGYGHGDRRDGRTGTRDRDRYH